MAGAGAGLALLLAAAGGCRAPESYRREADTVGTNLVQAYRAKHAGVQAPFSVERPSDTFRRRLAEDQALAGALGGTAATSAPAAAATSAKGAAPVIGMTRALQIGAQNNRLYQSAKEDMFEAALAMDLQADAFRRTWTGLLTGKATEDRSNMDQGGGSSGSEGESGGSAEAEPTRGLTGDVALGARRKFTTGAEIAAGLTFNLVKLLTFDRDSAYGLMADVSMTVPLLRGSGRDIVMEPLTQAERDLVYSVYSFERFKRQYAVRTMKQYYDVLGQRQQLTNLTENLKGVALAARRAEELGRAGRLPEVQVNLARQDELSGQDRLNTARQAVETALDGLKLELGLPTDARIDLDPTELTRLRPPGEGKSTVPPTEDEAVRTALDRRLDLRTALSKVEDAGRAAKVAADALRAGLGLKVAGSAGESRGLGSAGQPDGRIRPDEGIYTATLESDLPWERTKERNAYRTSLLALEKARRAAEETEDQVKLDVRNAYRTLREAGEAYRIQQMALELAQRRVDSTELLLQAGRAEMREVLEARESFVTAQNAVISARVAYRMAELGLLRDLETLDIAEDGGWREYDATGP